MNPNIEENREDIPILEKNPEVIFQLHLIEIYTCEIQKLRDYGFDSDNFEYIRFINMIKSCTHKIEIIQAFKLSNDLRISLRKAVKIVNNHEYSQNPTVLPF